MVAAVLVSGLAAPGLVLVLLVALGAVWITGFVNAFNFMDGVNGISGAHALIAGIVYACLGGWRHNGFLVPAGAAVAVSALAFLPWNAGQARVFLGDVGKLRAGRRPGVPRRVRRPARDPRRRPRSAPSPSTSPTPPGRCSGASGPASAGSSRTARTSTSDGATRDGRTSG